MKLYHLVLVFIIIAIGCRLINDIKTNDFNAVVKNKKQIDINLDTAMDDGVTSLVQVINRKIVINKDEAVNSFFSSLESSFGVLDREESKEKLNLYVPVVLVTLDDGYYIFYSDEYKSAGGKTFVSKRWSEKLPYYYEDDDFIYGFTLGDVVSIYDKHGLLDVNQITKVYQLDYHDIQTKTEYGALRNIRPGSFLLSDEAFRSIRKSTILSRLENSMAYYTSRHNRIAEQYGITYNFAFPSVHENDWESYLDDVGLFAVFQGYPYGDEAGETYNRFASAASKISKDYVYYLEQKDWYLVYHKDSCPEIESGNIVIKEEPYFDEESCIKEGAYACPVCIRNGIYAPDITKNFIKSNASLSALGIGAGAALQSDFNTTILNYNINVLYDTSDFNIIPAAADHNAIITVNDSTVISGNTWNITSPQPGQTNIITIKIVVPGKADTTYHLNVIRASSPYLKTPGFEIYESDGTKLSLSPAFHKTRTTPPDLPYNAGTVNVPYITVKFYAEDPNASIIINGSLVPDGQTYTYTFSDTGTAQFNVEVKSKTGLDSRNYAFKIAKS